MTDILSTQRGSWKMWCLALRMKKKKKKRDTCALTSRQNVGSSRTKTKGNYKIWKGLRCVQPEEEMGNRPLPYSATLDISWLSHSCSTQLQIQGATLLFQYSWPSLLLAVSFYSSACNPRSCRPKQRMKYQQSQMAVGPWSPPHQQNYAGTDPETHDTQLRVSPQKKEP